MFHIYFFNSNIYDQYIIRQINVSYEGLNFDPFVILFYFDDILSLRTHSTNISLHTYFQRLIS